MIFLFSGQVVLGQEQISLDGIWRDGEFNTKSVPGFRFMNDGKHYTRLVDNIILKYDITTGQSVGVLFAADDIKGKMGFDGKIDGYSFSEDETKLVIESEKESIYRRSYLAKYHVYDFTSKQLYTPYEEGRVMNATLSPDGTKIAYVFENNLYWFDLTTGITLPITLDGEKNKIINGITDWVYEEEFSFVKAFWWSPDNQRIVFLRFDETEVPEFQMTYYNDGVYPEYVSFKYPKVGQKNAKVTVHLYELKKDKSTPIKVGDLNDMYIPRVKWTQDPDIVCIYKMNRHQNHLQLILSDAKTGRSRLLLDEKNKYYIDITDDLQFLKDGKHFIWTSEKSGFNHIYKYDMSGKELGPITSGDYDVSAFYGIDEQNDVVYYQAQDVSPLETQVYRIKLNGKNKQLLSPSTGSNSAQFSTNYSYYTVTRSDINSAPTFTVYDKNTKVVRVIEDNASYKSLQSKYNTQQVEFFQFATREGVQLNGWMIKPPSFDPAKKYPVFMTQYSGPGSQQVTNGWKGANYWWFQKLAQDGFIVACVDPRGTGGRGEEFKKMTYLELGKYETIDQIEAAIYLGNQPYVDQNKIGIFGWSYGGYMSSLCILKGADVFKAAIAVAPVTNWKWYDTVYTERYMRTEEENPEGYRDNSPVYFADRLRGSFLLVHGGTDDNVHLQNSMEMSAALIKANKQYDTYIYPNQNHGIGGDNARLHLYTKMTSFLHEKLIKGDWSQSEIKP